MWPLRHFRHSGPKKDIIQCSYFSRLACIATQVLFLLMLQSNQLGQNASILGLKIVNWKNEVRHPSCLHDTPCLHDRSSPGPGQGRDASVQMLASTSRVRRVPSLTRSEPGQIQGLAIGGICHQSWRISSGLRQNVRDMGFVWRDRIRVRGYCYKKLQSSDTSNTTFRQQSCDCGSCWEENSLGAAGGESKIQRPEWWGSWSPCLMI